MIGNMSGPETGDIAIKKVALDRLAQTRRAARGIHFPARIENQRTSHGDVRLRTGTLLQGDDVAFGLRDVLFDAQRFAIDGANVVHCAFLSAKYSKKDGFFSAS